MSMKFDRESPQQMRSKERVETVLKATQEIIAERGYSALSLSAVCERANIKQTSIYRYWPNQTALLVSLISFFEDDFNRQIKLLEEEAFDMPWKEVQKVLLLNLSDYCSKNPWVYGGLAAVRAELGIAERHEQTLVFFATRYAHLLKIGGFAVRGEEEAAVSRTYVLLLDSFMFAVGRADGAPKVIDTIINEYYDVLTSYLESKMQKNNA
jgi:AcrR family transcriptional regulator